MKTKSRLLLIVFLMALVMLVGVFAVAPFTASAEGDGLSEETALIVTNYTTFKEAMEDSTIGYVKISSTFSSTITSETGALVVGVTLSTPKVLIVDGDATFVASALAGVDIVDSLIQTTNGAHLTIKGSGTLCFKANGSNATNAVVRIDGGTVNIQDTVTLHGSYNTATQGCAVLINTGDLNIWGGNLKGEAGKYSNTNYFGALELRGGNTVINANAVVVGNKYSGANLSGEHPDKLTALTVSESAYLRIHSGIFKLTEGVAPTSNSASIVVAESKKIGDYLFSGIRMLDAGTQQILATNVNKATVSVNFAIPTNIFTSQPTFQIESAGSNGIVSFALSGSNVYSDVQLIKETGTVGDEFALNHAGIHFSNVGNTYTATEYKGDGTYQTPEGNYKIAVKIGEDWYYSNVFAINYGNIVISDAFIVQPSFQIVSAGDNGTVSFTLNDGYIYSDVQLVKETGTAGDGFAVNHAGVHFTNVGFVYSATEYNGEGAYQTPEGNYKIAVKISEDWYYSNVFAIDYGAVTVHTVYYGVGEGQGSGDFESDIENGTIYTLKAFNEVGNIIPPEGKEFDYWSIRTGSAMGEEIAQKQANETITITADTYAIAIWKDLPTYVVAYAPGDGDGSTEFEYVTTGTTVTLLNPTDVYLGYVAPEGKLFAHWRVCKDNAQDPNAVVKKAGEEITITYDTYIIAVWNTIIYSVDIEGIIAPVDGEIHDISTITVNTEGIVGFETIQWCKSSSNTKLNPGVAFVAGQAYHLNIKFEVAEGYVLNPRSGSPYHADITINADAPYTSMAPITNFFFRLNYTAANLPVVSFDANGGGGEMTAIPDVKGDYELPACAFTAPTDYYFKAWAIGNVDGPQKKVGETITVSSDTTLYAIWGEYTTINTVNITGIIAPVDGEIHDISTITVNTEGIVGFATIQWCKSSSNTVLNPGVAYIGGQEYYLNIKFALAEGYRLNRLSNSPYHADITINADAPYTSKESMNNFFFRLKYTATNPSTVSFDANGGTGSMAPSIDQYGPYELPSCAFTAPNGKQFKAWAIGSLEGEQKAPGEQITVTDDVVIYAIWKDIPVATGLTASYNGTILAGNKLAINSLTVKLQYSDSSEMPCAGLCEYWYQGSKIQDPINYVFGVELIGNLTITVKYQGFETTFDVQVVGYAISFNANGGTGTMANVEYVGAYTLPACTFTAPNGKQFKGWATSQNGEVISGTTNVTADLVLYAIWEDIPSEEPENPNGGSGSAGGNEGGQGGSTPAPTPDTTPEEEAEAGLSGGAIAGIAVGAVAVAGVGGFAIFWFVIKKKSVADLLAIFKK